MEIKDIENTIINADCMDILKELPDKCIDLVLTDPPYGINASSSNFMRVGKKQDNQNV
jgi:DNA modification methylase